MTPATQHQLIEKLTDSEEKEGGDERDPGMGRRRFHAWPARQRAGG